MTERTGEADEETDIVKRRSTKNEAARTGGVSPPFKQGFLLWHESRILGHPSNPVCGFSKMEQVGLGAFLAHGELYCLLVGPDTGLDHCPRIVL